MRRLVRQRPRPMRIRDLAAGHKIQFPFFGSPDELFVSAGDGAFFAQPPDRNDIVNDIMQQATLYFCIRFYLSPDYFV